MTIHRHLACGTGLSYRVPGSFLASRSGAFFVRAEGATETGLRHDLRGLSPPEYRAFDFESTASLETEFNAAIPALVNLLRRTTDGVQI